MEKGKKMGRLIDIDEAYKVLTDYYHHRTEIQHKALKEAIERVPTVDAEPVKHGHWVEVQRIHETDHTAICECSLCGDTVWVYDGQRAWNYCPRCGAKMEVEDVRESD